MIHLRVVAPASLAEQALAQLMDSPAVTDVVHLSAVVRKPEADLILCDVVREETGVIVDELRDLGLVKLGSISIDKTDTQISDAAARAEAAAIELPFGDQVVWEEVEARTSEETALSINFL